MNWLPVKEICRCCQYWVFSEMVPPESNLDLIRLSSLKNYTNDMQRKKIPYSVWLITNVQSYREGLLQSFFPES